MSAMDWSAMGVWWDRDALDTAKLDHYRCEYVYVDAHDPSAADRINQTRAAHRTPGLFFDPHWVGPLDAKYQAKQVYDKVMSLLKPGEPVMLDIEQLPIEWTRMFLNAYHAHLPKRPTSVTFGPGQDSSVIPATLLNLLGMHVYVQLYDNDMHDAPAKQVVPAVADLVRKGLSFDKIHYFYGGAGIPWDFFDGCIFTLADIPAIH